MKRRKKKGSYLAMLVVFAIVLAGFLPVENLWAASGSRTVKSQAQLEAALKDSNIKKITIKTDKTLTFSILKSTYSGRTLIVDAPNATVKNKETFKSITIQNASKYYEQGKSNRVLVAAKRLTFNVPAGTSVGRLTLAAENGIYKVNVNGALPDMRITQKAKVTLKGTTTKAVTVCNTADGTVMVSQIKTALKNWNDMSVQFGTAAAKGSSVSTKGNMYIQATANAPLTISILKKDIDVRFNSNAEAAKVTVKAPASVLLSGNGSATVNIAATAGGAKIGSSMKVNLDVSADAVIYLAEGAEGSAISTKTDSVRVAVENETEEVVRVQKPTGIENVPSGSIATGETSTEESETSDVGTDESGSSGTVSEGSGTASEDAGTGTSGAGETTTAESETSDVGTDESGSSGTASEGSGAASDSTPSGSDTTMVAVTSILLKDFSGGTASTVEIGTIVSLIATVMPGNATNKTVSWNSSNPSIATVVGGETDSSLAVIIAKSAGTAVITATAQGNTAQNAAYILTVNGTKESETTGGSTTEGSGTVTEGSTTEGSGTVTEGSTTEGSTTEESGTVTEGSATEGSTTEGSITEGSGTVTEGSTTEGSSTDLSTEADSGAATMTATGIELKIKATGEYTNWDGTSNVAQFLDGKGEYAFAYDSEKYVYVVHTKAGAIDRTVRLEKVHETFGGLTCDTAGNYYLVTGETNATDDTTKETIFISLYDSEGNLVKTAGDNGSSSLAYYYDASFYTKNPFDAGNCDVAVNGDYVTVHYAREMYSGHQSDSVFTVHTGTLESADVGDIYQSHCFAQRVIPYKNGFLFAGEGDCFDRAFTLYVANSVSGTSKKMNLFHFWVKEGTYDSWDMYTLNNNFAHMGGLAMVDDTNAALVGSSVKALNSAAETQTEQLFIQIFDPGKDLSDESSYVTSGVRSGFSGKNGDEAVTDYGVLWLSDFGSDTSVSHPQVVSDGKGTILVLYEKYVNGKYQGVFGTKLQKDGTVLERDMCLSSRAYLNPSRMPIYLNGKVYWTANQYNDSKNQVYICNFVLNP